MIRSSLTKQRRSRGIQRIPSLARQIEAALLADFTDRTCPRFEKFITAIDDLGLPVPALSACGQGTREIRYTQLLAYYLDPRRPHGLRHRCLTTLFGDDVCRLTGRPIDWSDARVTPEFSDLPPIVGLPHSSIDLVIEVPSERALVVVEQKLFSAEGGAGDLLRQLERYSEVIATRFPGYRGGVLKIFLAPKARAYSDQSWQLMTHDQVVRRLTGLLHDASLSNTARQNLASLLWDLAMGPLAVETEAWGAFVDEVRAALVEPKNYIGFPRRVRNIISHYGLLLDIVEAT